MSKVRLNGQNFWVLEGAQIQPYLVDPQGAAYRTQGTQRRMDNKKINRFAIAAWNNTGIGAARVRRDRLNEYGEPAAINISGMKDADAETRFQSMVTLPLLAQTETHASDADHFVKAIHFKGDLWGLFENDYASATIGIVARKWGASSDNWTGGGDILNGSDTGNGMRGWDMITHKAKLFVLSSSTDANAPYDQAYSIELSSDGASWAAAGMTGFPKSGNHQWTTTAKARRNNFNDNQGLLLDFGGTLLAAVWSDSTSVDGSAQVSDTITVFYSTDLGENWSEGAVIPSGDGPKAFVVWNDPFTAGLPLIPVLVTQENIYKVSHSSTAFSAMLPEGVLSGTSNTGRGAAIGAGTGALYVGTEDGDILEFNIVSQGSLQIENVGPASKTHREDGDGLVAARQGHANSILGSSSRWLLVAYGGHASGKNASILAMDYKSGAWHSLYKDGTADRDIYGLVLSGEDDGTMRLHASTEHDDASIMVMFEEPLASPASGVTQSFAATGYVEWSEDDLGDPMVNSAVLQALVDADDLSAATDGEYIAVKYGTDGAAWNAVTLGNFLSGDKDLSFGSGVGLSAKTLRLRLEFNRDAGNVTHTPKMKELEIQARTRLATLKGFRIPIDIGMTAQRERIKPQEVITRLEAIVDSVPLIAFVRDPDRQQAESLNVEVTGYDARTAQAGEAVSVASEQAGGVWLIDVEEVL